MEIEILDTYIDTDDKKTIYYKGGLANGPVNAAFIMSIMNKFTK